MAAESPEPPADSKILASIKDLKLDFANGLDGMKTAIEEIMSDVKDCLDWTISGAEDNIVVLENRVEDLEVENLVEDLENKHSDLEEERESISFSES